MPVTQHVHNATYQEQNLSMSFFLHIPEIKYILSYEIPMTFL
jgi:hypothetical protein